MSNDPTKTMMRLWLLVLWAVLIPRPAGAVMEVFQVNAGNDSYRSGDYEKSVEKYTEALKKDSESDIINFNLGAAYYKQDRFDKALDHLRKAVLSEDDALRQRAYYNLGNTLYQSGRLFLEDQDLAATITYYEDALAEYEKALELSPDDTDTRHNYEFVKKELEQLKQQQQQNQNQQQNQQQQDQQQDQNQQQDQQQQDQQQQDQQQQDQQQQDQQQQDQQQQDQQQDQQQQDQQQQDQQQQDQQQQDQQQQDQQQQDQQQQDQQQQDQQQQDQQQQDQQQNQSQNQPRNRPPSAADQPPADFDDLTQQEAQMLLEDYRQNDEPKGLLPIRPRMITDPVTKDW